LEEKDLTPKQREWLEASRRIGPGAMTRTERESLERLYKEMLPAEQQELRAYVEKHFGKKDAEADKTKGEQKEDILAEMERKTWLAPSPALSAALSGSQPPKPRRRDDKS